MISLSIRTLTRWLTPWRTIRRLQTENQQLREQAVLSAAINQELSILAKSRQLKIEAHTGPVYRLPNGADAITLADAESITARALEDYEAYRVSFDGRRAIGLA